MADSFFQILEGLQVSREEILEAESFSKQYLRANFPDLDLREGVALYDLVIRPTSTMVALVKKGLDFYFSSNTVANVTDDTPEDIVDKLMSNLFLERNVGSSSIVRARLYFLDSNRNVNISSSATFSTDNVVTFKPVVDTQIRAGLTTDDPAGDFQYDTSRDEYFYDIDLISTTQDESANIESGDFIYFSNIDPYYVGSSIIYLAQKAVPRETNTAFVDRASTAISTRNLINDISIDSQLKSTFNYVNDVVVAGYGDEEMERDAVVVYNSISNSEWDLHLGGKVDVYIDAITATQDPPELLQLEIPTNGIVDIPADQGSRSYVIYSIRRATDEEIAAVGIDTGQDIPPDASLEIKYGSGEYSFDENVDYFVENGQKNSNGETVDVKHSMRQVTRLIVTHPLVASGGFKITVRYWRFTGLKSIQEFFDDTATKVVCADYLARSLNNYAIDINVKRVGNLPLNSGQLDKVREILASVFNNMNAGQSLIVSNLVKAIVAESGISDIDVGIQVNYVYFSKHSGPIAGSITSFKDCDRTDLFVLRNVTSITS